MVVNQNLYSKVMKALEFEPSFDASNITIAIKDKGVVVLGGLVENYTAKRVAEDTVKKVEGVKGVANELEIDLSEEFERKDVDIAEQAVTALQWNTFIPNKDIKVTVENGRLALSGEVEYCCQKTSAENCVQDILGIRGVTNNITIKPKVEATQVKQKIIDAFERSARLDAYGIEVEVNGREVILNGKVKNWDENNEAIQVAWSVPGVSSVVDNLKVA